MLYIGVLLILVLQFLRPQEWLGAIEGDPVVFYAMLLLLPPWVFTLTRKKVLRTPIDLFLLFFYIACVLSYWHWKKSAFFEPMGDFGKVFLIYLFVTHVVDTRRRLSGAIWTILLMLLIVAMMAGTATEGPEEGTYISIGAFKDRNDFGAAMATILPFAVIFCLKGKAIEKFLGLILLAVATHGVIASDSRGAQLACIAGLCFTFYLLATSKMARRAALVAGVVGLGIAFLASARLQSIGGYVDDRSAMGRVEAWGVVLENFPSYPLFGRGFGKYRSWMPRGLDTHSSYMRAAGELGIIGLFSYLGMLFVAFRKGYNLTRVDTAPSQGVRILAIASMGALAVNATASLFLTRLYYPFVLVQIGLISSLWIIADRERRLNQSGGLTPPGGVDDERNLWVASRGMGLATRRLVSSMDIAKVVGIVIVCLVSYKIMVLTST